MNVHGILISKAQLLKLYGDILWKSKRILIFLELNFFVLNVLKLMIIPGTLQIKDYFIPGEGGIDFDLVILLVTKEWNDQTKTNQEYLHL